MTGERVVWHVWRQTWAGGYVPVWPRGYGSEETARAAMRYWVEQDRLARVGRLYPETRRGAHHRVAQGRAQ